ncbi:hypothetical protein [Oryzifoliimicrobium ureilyticus]|uniref:hypothetical protein n=1 Tax=Oryzifoliimicrobium ureilyticus TaxID=3113724 RepID=UPI003075F689
MSTGPKVAIYSRSESGHRGDYIRFAKTTFCAERISPYKMFFEARPILFLMIEDSFFLYVLSSLWRSLCGRRTVGLLFRPGPAVEGATIRLSIKRAFLKSMKKISLIRTLTIVPFYVEPTYEQIADGWIYDFQLWDLTDREIAAGKAENAAFEISEVHGRTVLGAVGSQDRRKGFDIFAQTWVKNSEIRSRYLFLFGGKTALDCDELAEQFSANGGKGLNRRISDEDLLSIYAVADLIWCLYSKDYDQASGIFGRAVQFGIPVLVREGSVSHRICLEKSIPHIASTEDGLASALNGKLPRRDPKLGGLLAKQFRLESLATLQAALGHEG